VLQLTVASDTHQDTRRFRSANREWRFSAESPQAKMFTTKEPLSPHWCELFHHWRHRTYRAVGKINAGHRLIDLQRSRLAGLGINVVPIVKTKRHVAVFLYFKDDNVV
jgi:hypothetical protein